MAESTSDTPVLDLLVASATGKIVATLDVAIEVTELDEQSEERS